MKTMKDNNYLQLKYDILLLADVFEKIFKKASKIMDHVRVIISAHQL